MMKSYGKILPVLVFFGLVYALAVSGLVQEDKAYSASENRVLQKFPKLSKKRILNGKFQKKYEIYLSDQFPARDIWVQAKSKAERLSGKTESNGVFFGKDGYLLEKYTKEDFDKKQVRKNIRALEKFVDGMDGLPVTVLMAPSKTDIMEKCLPPFAESYDESLLYEKLVETLPEQTLLPIREELKKHADEELYYRNDHHWTTLGAWYGYQLYLSSVRETEELPDMEKKKQALKTVSENFLGTTYSKVNLYSRLDSIEIYEPEGEFSVVYNMGEKTEESFYQWDYLEKKDQYSVFSGGNQGVLEITGGEKNGKTLLVVKDSFANCMIPFFMEDYEKIVVVDMRQLNAGLFMAVRMYQPSEVLVLYNIVQFMQDREFAMKVK